MSHFESIAVELLEALKSAVEHLEYCGYGDSWERGCANHDKLPEKLQFAISKAEGLLNVKS
jgi:hypothetical protein